MGGNIICDFARCWPMPHLVSAEELVGHQWVFTYIWYAHAYAIHGTAGPGLCAQWQRCRG